MKYFNRLSLLAIIFIIGCSTKKTDNELLTQKIKQYSEFVRDAFYIDIQLPKEYFKKPGKKYPTVILLDGNFYFPMLSSVVHQYEFTGLLEPVILISVGYQSFQMMDSLRVRDYLYPKALPSDELKTEGGAQRFKDYLTKELLSKIDSEFRTDQNNRVLLGHSFGGYFVLYCLLNQLETKENNFKSFISASPALWYNNFFLKKLPQQLNGNRQELNLFITVGGLEDSTWSVKPVEEIAYQIQKVKIEGLRFNSRVYSHLDHMDVALLSFTKGLEEVLKK
jgi:predicted alpha/beta superfamily hydrolase